jgi:hypothetical protein
MGFREKYNERYVENIRKKVERAVAGDPRQLSYYVRGRNAKQLRATIQCFSELGYRVVTQAPRMLLGSEQGTSLVFEKTAQ